MNLLQLEKGLHDIQIYYFDVGYGAEMRLLWARPGEHPHPIPEHFFQPPLECGESSN
jgi:hypothetical protein